MRITSFAVLTLLASGAAWAGTHSESTTYVDGNLTGISPDTGATLSFTDDNGITLRTGLATVSIPYSGIHHVELGAVQETSHNVPFYKVWALHKRFAARSQTQLLIVNFKNDQDEEKNMTLEFAEASIQNVLTAMESHAGKNVELASAAHAALQKASAQQTSSRQTRIAAARKTPSAAADDSWWGDKYWKTKNNEDKWSKPSTANAPDQQ